MPARRVPVNAAALLFGRLSGALVTIVVASVSAHRLDHGQFGLVASTMAAGFLANALVTFGTDTVIIRAVAAERADAFNTVVVALKFQLTAAAALATAVAIAVALGAHHVLLIQVVALFPMAIVTVSGAVLRGAQQMNRLLIASVAGAIATLAALVAGFSFGNEPWAPILALGVGSTVAAVVSAWFAARSLDTTTITGAVAPLLRETAPFAAMVILAATAAQGGLLLVEFASDETAGGYGVAVRLSEAARLVPAAAMGAFFPAMLSGLHKTERYRRWLRLLVAYAVAVTIGLVALAAPINRIVFAGQPSGAVLIRILALGLVFTVARLALSFELIAGERERAVLVSALVGTGVMLAAGLVSASRFGAQGIAWAQLAGLVSAVLVLAAHSRTDRRWRRRRVRTRELA